MRKNKWIEISECLPENEHPVLCYMLGIQVVCSYEDDKWIQSDDTGREIKGVTHWQHLPSDPNKSISHEKE